MSEIDVKRVTCGYGDRILLKELSFSVDKPSFIGILGHNGCGKSTFFKTLLNIQPFQGEILLKGSNNKHLSRRKFAATAGSLLQTNPLTFDISVEDLVVTGRFRHKKLFINYSSQDYSCVYFTLEKLGLLHLCKKQFGNLSGGEKQLVWLAQLLLQDPEIYLLDEPTQQLDLRNKKKVFNLMEDLVYAGKTVLCITHDVHCLKGIDGYILNLSKERPEPEQISDENLARHILLLESDSFADSQLFQDVS